MVFTERFGQGRGVSLATACACAILMPAAARASGFVAVGAANPGPTPFISNIEATIGGATLASVTYAVLSKPGSLVAPLTAKYSASYLSAHGYGSGNSVTVPVWGLYAGSNNTVVFLFSFTDGSNAVAFKPVTTAVYTDPCAPINAPVLQQNRTLANNIGFNYFLLKDYCSTNTPSIVDTDGHQRWVGTADAGSIASTFYNNGVYVSDGHTGVDRIELTGQVSKVVDFASQGVTSTDVHNMDPGRNGIVLDVSTTAETESTAVEFDATTGAQLNAWDAGHIISEAMTAGGDNPNDFVAPAPVDWFHMNATAYNPNDGTEIISSRENFVMDVDYDLPSDGVRKIHWILGDTTKKWYSFPSLRKFALQLGPNTLPPIGQHGISVNQQGDLMLFDDGEASTYQVPAGIERGYSAGRSYKIDTTAMTATEVLNYTPEPHIFAPFCGSFYEPTPNSYLIDFPTADNETETIIQGLSGNNRLVFSLQYGQSETCGSGWNALPFPNESLTFN